MHILFLILFLILFPVIGYPQDNLATENWSTPVEIKIISSTFPDGVNTPYISSDGKTLYFESSGVIYAVEKTDTGWTSPHIASTMLNGIKAVNPKISHDNTKLFFTKEGSIFFLERKNVDQEWGEIQNCGSNINNYSTIINDYYLPNDSVMVIWNNSEMYNSVFNKSLNLWEPLFKNVLFSEAFFSFNSGNIFINFNFSKVYHTSLFYCWNEEDGKIIEIFKDELYVCYKNDKDELCLPQLLNINSEIDTILNTLSPFSTYFVLSPSLSEDGKDIYFGINYFGIPKVYYSRMLVDEKGDTLSSVKFKNDNLPSRYNLLQNYPNPFNPTTTITFHIPTSSHVTLAVYDLLGREVKTLVNKEMKPGNYKVTFDGTNLGSGVYVYRLGAGEFVQTRKLLLLK
ncbi:MAG: T9SS type A sorting domain-containing protein [Bacteroidota bacterium]